MPAENQKQQTESESCGSCTPAGPTREKGGTTGAENLSPAAANRTGGATSGVNEGDPIHEKAKKLTPDP